MYLLVTIKDASKVSEAIAALLKTGLTQFTTGEKMSDICVDCQNRTKEYSMDAHSLISDSHETTANNSQLCDETIFKTEAPEEDTGVPAEDLFPEREEDEDIKPDGLNMLPSTSGNISDDMEPSSKKMKMVSENEAAFASLCASLMGDTNPMPDRVYDSVSAPSKKGQRPILLYRFGDKCYAFQYKHTKRDGDTYSCISCKNAKSNTKSVSITVSITVTNGKFRDNPETLAHVCTPRNWIKEMAERHVMEALHKFKSLEERGDEKPIFVEMLRSIYDDQSIPFDERKAIIEQLGDFKRFKTICTTAWRRKAAAATEEEVAAEEA